MYRIHTTLCLTVIILLFCCELSAQQIIARRMPFLDQLSFNEITNIYQDRDGYIWVGTSNGLERYDGYGLERFRTNYFTSNKLSNNHINCFTEDDRFLWVGTRAGVNLLDKKTYEIIPFPDRNVQRKIIYSLLIDSQGQSWIAAGNQLFRCGPDLSVENGAIYSFQSSNITCVYEDKEGNIWVMAWGEGLFKYQPGPGTFQQYPPVGKENIPFNMIQDNNGNYWIATWGDGLYSFNPENAVDNMYHHHPVRNYKTNKPEGIFFSLIHDDVAGYLWALSYSQLNVFEILEDGNLKEIDPGLFVDKSKMYSKLSKDRAGNLWLGSFDEGYNIIFQDTAVINYQLPEIKEKIGFDANITTLCEDMGGNIWFNQERYGLCLFDKNSHRIVVEWKGYKERTMDIGLLCRSNKSNDVWAAGRSDRVVLRMGYQNGNIVVREEIDLVSILETPGNITNLLEDRHGNLWIITPRVLFIHRYDDRKTILIEHNLPIITGITEDPQGNIWIANSQKGIHRLNYSGAVLSVMDHYYDGNYFSGNDYIAHFCIDGRGTIWIGSTLGRLVSFDTHDNTFADRSGQLDVAGKDILKVLVGEENIWIVTNKELIQHNLLQEENIHYSTSDQNIFVQAFRGAACIGASGKIYAGGYGGFISVQPTPDDNRTTKPVYPARITDVRINNQSLYFTDSLQTTLGSVEKIVLAPDSKNIEILFSSLTYLSNNKVKYAYQLEGIDKDWITIKEGRRVAFYNLLPKGHYTFKVISDGGTGEWGSEITRLQIHKLPAWYETWYAWLIYLAFSLFAVYLLISFYSRQLRQKNARELQEELAQTKLNYFTNISHELLTPLTIISCVADTLETDIESAGKQAGVLRSNVNRLKRLLQQVLDFRKIEQGRMALNVSKGNIAYFLTNAIQANFQPLAEKKDILLSVDLNQESIWGYLDFDKLDKIMYNLLSNAIKYTPAHKRIKVYADSTEKNGHEYIIIRVADEGIGIPSKEINQIFTRFYNNRNRYGSESNGIGLSLTRELVKLHHGQISVESQVHKGTTFTVEIPIDEGSYPANERIDLPDNRQPEPPEQSADEEDNRPCLMIVDDSKELLDLMRNLFAREYKVITALSGEEGCRKLKHHPVDIIISDVMMPGMNGLDFCRFVKDTIDTSHIPVLMLTAKNTPQAQTECYYAGANGYLSKPFELKMLYARIENLIKLNEKRQQAFRRTTDVNISTLDYQTPDEKFLQQAIACIEKHMIDTDFTVIALSNGLRISTTTLNRKIKAMTGLSTIEFIRNIRLKHACILLKKPFANISDVAYTVGFSNPKYFSKCFKDEFGMIPSEYQKMKIDPPIH